MPKDLEINVGRRKVKTEFLKMHIDELHFYPHNPRISSITMNFKGKLDDDTVHNLMDKEQPEATRKLFQIIKKDGNINEPLIVYKDRVLEGNTRLWVARELFKRAKTSQEKNQWTLIPCRKIESNLSDEEINHILCNAHIKTKKDWIPFEQACYFARMKIEENMTYDKIKEITNFAPSKIKDYIEVFQEMKKNKAEPKDWNRYYEAYKDKDVQKVHKSGEYDIIKTIKKKTEEGKMGVAQDSRKLSAIVKSPRAKKEFFEKDADIKRAYEISILDNPHEADPILKRIYELEEDLRHIGFKKVEEFRTNKKKRETLKKLTEVLINLCKTVDIKIEAK